MSKLTKDEQPGLVAAHQLLSDYFEELAAEWERAWWRPFRRKHIIMQTRALKELGARLVARKRKLSN